ncbi:MAG: hypothetical protein HON90_09065 [Halobacteriovoraceae bacterium]|jgi:hypothetical protein|nr:hypothetical protein [Halobacteriovoraceae bacterium]
MKLLFITTILILTTLVMAKDSLKEFSQSMDKNIQSVVKDNPQMYETKSFSGRKPASVESTEESSTDKLDAVEEQADTHQSW